MGVNPDTYVRHLIKKTRVSWRILCFLGEVESEWGGGGDLLCERHEQFLRGRGLPPPLQKKGLLEILKTLLFIKIGKFGASKLTYYARICYKIG